MSRQTNIAAVTAAELSGVNGIITAAVLNWPMAARLKRVALDVLTYDSRDLREMQMLMARTGGEPAGIAAWDPATVLHAVDGWRGVLLHGLYVHPDRQGQGVGAALQQAVAEQAADLDFDALVVKSERVSVGYFERCGYERLPADALEELEYPYLFRYPLNRLEPAAGSS